MLELVGGSPWTLLRCLLVALVAGVLFEIPVQLGRMGPGDTVLALGLGALLGRYGWSAALAGLAAFVLLAGFWSVGVLLVALVRRRPVRGREVPLGPFMLLGTLVAVLGHSG